MRVWIDLANSPHPLVFAPIARRLEELGHSVLLTARDQAQTVELAAQTWPRFDVIGGASPAGRAAKARALAARIRALAGWARRNRPNLALSHNSYAQIAAARAARIPAVTAMDYEFQPANHLAFRLARRVLVPEAMPLDVARRQGAHERKVRRYGGLKEELYLGQFDYDPAVASGLGIDLGPGEALVVARTPPSGALYHDFENTLFTDALKEVARQGSARCVVLTRHREQREAIERLGLANCVLPRAAVDSRSLIYGADLVLGAGGTMTREAALMGVPTLSLFAGRTPGVDSWLERRGLLGRLTNPDQLRPIRPRTGEPADLDQLRARGGRLVDRFVAAALEP